MNKNLKVKAKNTQNLWKLSHILDNVQSKTHTEKYWKSIECFKMGILQGRERCKCKGGKASSDSITPSRPGGDFLMPRTGAVIQQLSFQTHSPQILALVFGNCLNKKQLLNFCLAWPEYHRWWQLKIEVSYALNTNFSNRVIVTVTHQIFTHCFVFSDTGANSLASFSRSKQFLGVITPHIYYLSFGNLLLF